MACASIPTVYTARRSGFRRESLGLPAMLLRGGKSGVRCGLETEVSDMSVNAPKGLFPPEPERYRGPKLKVAIIGAGLAGMSTAVELLDQGHEVDIYESRSFIGGKVGSFIDKRGNHIEMGLHVFFGCYNNLFRLMKKVGADQNLLVKDHVHTFVNKGGQIGDLDFRFPIGAPIHGIRAFLTTNQLQTYDKARNAFALATSPIVKALIDPEGAMKDIRDLDSISFSEWFLSKGGTRLSIQRMWDPVAYALGFIDCDNISARCMLTVFGFFATKTEASLLRMLKGSPDNFLSGPIQKYIISKGGRFHLRWGCRDIYFDKSIDGETYVTGLALSKATTKQTVQADAYVAACDVPGIKKLLPLKWRQWEAFDNIYKLVGVPVITVQLRYNGWVTELQDVEKSRKKTAREMWIILEQMYGQKKRKVRVYQLMKDIYSLKQGNLSVAEFYAALKSKWEDLDYHSDINWGCPHDQIQCMAKEWENRVFLFLSGLNDEFENIRSQILNSEESFSIEDVYSRVEAEEQRKMITTGKILDHMPRSDRTALVSRAPTGSNRTLRQCTHCKKSDHTVDFCWDLHPEKKNNKGRGKKPTSNLGDGKVTISTEQICELRAYLSQIDIEQTDKSDEVKVNQALAISGEQGLGDREEDWDWFGV